MSVDMKDSARLPVVALCENLRAHLAQLQAAPAELGVVMPEAKQALEWIPVGERLPETETAISVLIYRPDAHEMPANDPNVTIKRYSNEGGFSSIHKVTHWMPLPAAPATADSDVREVKK